MKKIIYSLMITFLFAICITGVQADEIEVVSYDLDLSYGQHDLNTIAIKDSMISNSNVLTLEMKKNINLNDSVLTVDQIDITKIGNQSIITRLELVYFDKSILGINNIASNINISIQDRVAPEIVLSSNGVTKIDLGDEFNPMDLVIEVTDNKDNLEDLDIYYESSLDVNSSGDYEVTYFAIDTTGNTTTITHSFTVQKEQIRYIFYGGGDANDISDTFYEKGIADLGDEYIELPNIPLYTQDNNNSYIKSGSSTCGSTISRYGCALVTFAMVAHSYNDEITVETVNNLGYSSSGCYFGFFSAASYYDLSFSKLNVPYKTTESKNILRGMLREGQPAIIELKSYATGGTHFVVVYAYRAQDNWETFFVKNPTNGNYDSLESLLKTKYISKIYYLR